MSNLSSKLQKSSRLILYIICFPYIFYLGWKKESAFESSNWESLIAYMKKIGWFGGFSPRDLFLMAYAHSSLGRFDEAIKFIEIIQAPLEDIDEEACRYYSHAWILYKLGEIDHSKALLEYSVSEEWSSHRREWAKDFLNSMGNDDLLNGNAFRPNLSIH